MFCKEYTQIVPSKFKGGMTSMQFLALCYVIGHHPWGRFLLFSDILWSEWLILHEIAPWIALFHNSFYLLTVDLLTFFLQIYPTDTCFCADRNFCLDTKSAFKWKWTVFDFIFYFYLIDSTYKSRFHCFSVYCFTAIVIVLLLTEFLFEMQFVIQLF